MRARSGTTALVAGIFATTVGLAAPAAAQTSTTPADTGHRFSLFGGVAAAESSGPENGFELGGSGDFRWAPIPVPLRLSLSFSQRDDDAHFTSRYGGKASLDLVLRPFPKKLGIRPYFLGGLGVATRAGYAGWIGGYVAYPYGAIGGLPLTYLNRPRATWAFASAGMGLDIGRAFIQLKLEHPVASQGPNVVPLNVGFRFWD
jgi:hypothetical protein